MYICIYIYFCLVSCIITIEFIVCTYLFFMGVRWGWRIWEIWELGARKFQLLLSSCIRCLNDTIIQFLGKEEGVHMLTVL